MRDELCEKRDAMHVSIHISGVVGRCVLERVLEAHSVDFEIMFHSIFNQLDGRSW